jgi:hypothetical protein
MEVEFPTTLPDGSSATAFCYYYPPQNALYQGTEGEFPVMLVKLHGGPTSSTSTILRLDIQVGRLHFKKNPLLTILLFLLFVSELRVT